MGNLRRVLPSLDTLVLFEAAARLKSFTRAAEELGVSQAAVSYAIKQLEGALGERLFDRRHRAVALTTPGQHFHERISLGLAHIERAAEDVRQGVGQDHVTISMSTAFASHWMLPRLATLRYEMPDIDLRLHTADRDVDLRSERMALGIRRGNADWPGYDHALFTTEVLVAVASSSYLEAMGRPDWKGDLSHHTLIYSDDLHRPRPSWNDWFDVLKILFRDDSLELRLNDHALVVQAAIEGEGIALGSRHIVQLLLESGFLELASEEAIETGSGIYVVWPEHIQLSPDAERVRDWLIGEARRVPGRYGPIYTGARGPGASGRSSHGTPRQTTEEKALVNWNIRCVAHTGDEVGETPLWSMTERALYWVDVTRPRIHRWDEASGEIVSHAYDEEIGSIGLREGGGLVAAMRSGFYLIDTRTGERTHIVDPEPDKPYNCLNDGRCDRHGRFWAGSAWFGTGESGEEPPSAPTAALYRLDRDGTVTRVLDGLYETNTVAWSPDDATIYVGDSRPGEIRAYAFEATSGEVGDGTLFTGTREGVAFHDGSAVDSEGCLWTTIWNGSRIVRFAPDGRSDLELSLPVSKPTACCFGGDDLRTLFVTTATWGLGEKELREQPWSGGILAIHVSVQGIAEATYAG